METIGTAVMRIETNELLPENLNCISLLMKVLFQKNRVMLNPEMRFFPT